MQQPRIAVIGPESTGKSTLCSQLAAHSGSLWVPEYAREYLEIHGLSYTYDDLLIIARNQLRVEDEIAAKAGARPVFIDTNMYVMKVWCEYVFEKCHQYILDQVVARTYDYYLLCNIDLPWEEQPMREYPDVENRQRLFCMYKDILVNQHVPWSLVSGKEHERFKAAANAVMSLL